VLHSYCKFLKLTNGEEIIVTTDNDCSDFKSDRYLSIIDPVEVKAMQMVRGPHIVETQVMQPWIRLAKDDIIQIPTDNILIAVDVEDDVADQYAKFLYEQHIKTLPPQDREEMVENFLEDLESENSIDGNDYDDEDQRPTVH
jgi:hypothetical protein